MLTPSHRSSLSSLFPAERVILDLPGRLPYELDAGPFTALPDAVVILDNAEETVRLVKWAAAAGVPIVSRGAGTGLTGGAIAHLGGVVASFARLKEVRRVDVASRLAWVDPGLVNHHLQQALAAYGLIFPPDPASYAVSTLGGNIAENAGGPHCLKYGVTANYVQGLEVTLADASRVWLGGPALDPPEFDFTSLLTGSEGTLGLITQAVLRLRRSAAGVKTLTASFNDVTGAGRAVSAVIAAGLTPATIELMDHNMINIVEDYLALGLLRQAAALLIFDVEGYPESLDQQLDAIAAILAGFSPLDLTIARSEAERERLWLGRRNASGAVARISPSEYVLDVCVPRSRLGDALAEINAITARYGFPVAYLAHAGDGNLHPGMLCDLSIEDDRRRVHLASAEILQYCARIGGSIGGEHGIGIEKRAFMLDMYSPAELEAMLQVKQVFDPGALFNPGKIFPSDLTPELTAGPPTAAPPLPDPPAELAPASPAEAAGLLAGLRSSTDPIYLCGAAAQWRPPLPASGFLLTSRRLTGVLKLAPDDFYVTALAGTPLVDLQAALADAGFWLPAASPWPAATLGGLFAANLSSPLRLLYGSLRDLVLSAQVAFADGRLLRFGRPLAKDVAGYQMHKLFCASHGTLGLVTELTFKIFSPPLARRGLAFTCERLDQAVTLGLAALQQATICSSALIAPGDLMDSSQPGCTLLLTLEGHPADVAAELAVLLGLLHQAACGAAQEVAAPSAAGLWTSRQAAWPASLRCAVPPGRLLDFFAALASAVHPADWLLDLAAGLYLCSVEPAAADHTLFAMRRSLLSFAGSSPAGPSSGYAVFEAGPRSLLTQIPAWGDRGPVEPLMRKLKLAWDPGNKLNRDEFISMQFAPGTL